MFQYGVSRAKLGEGNGNPFQCSCLENPRDRGAWWAAVYGVTQNWTWLKRLSNRGKLHGKITNTECLLWSLIFIINTWSKLCWESTFPCNHWKLQMLNSMEEGMATHSSVLAWRIPWTEEPGGLQSMGSQGVGQDWVTNTCLWVLREQYSIQSANQAGHFHLTSLLRGWGREILLLPVWDGYLI